MKRFILFSVLLTMLFSTAFAQKSNSGSKIKINTHRKHEISLNYGYGSFNQIIGAVIVIGSFGLAHRDLEYTGAIGAEYLYYPIANIGVGGSVVYEYGHGTSGENNENHSRHHYITLMPTAKFYWFNQAHVGMYSRLGVGATYVSGKYNDAPDNSWRPAFQASLVSIDFGREGFRGFLELGCGTQGFISGGFRVRF